MPAGAVEDDDGMGVGGDTADLGEMQVHGLGVDGGSTRPAPSAALRADRAEQVGPLVALVARWRGRVPALPRPGSASPFWPMRASSWNQISSGLPRRGGKRRLPPREVFLNVGWAASSACGCCGRADSRVKPAGQDPPDLALRQGHPEALGDHALQVDAAPAHHAVHRHLRPGLDDRDQRLDLPGRQPRRPPGPRPVDQPRDPLGIVAVHPVPQRLPVHPAARAAVVRSDPSITSASASIRRACAVSAARHASRRSSPAACSLRSISIAMPHSC